MPPLAFDDHELTTLMHFAQPLDPNLRDAFLQHVAGELQHYPERGDGLLHRIARAAQRQYLNGVPAHDPRFHSKYR